MDISICFDCMSKAEENVHCQLFCHGSVCQLVAIRFAFHLYTQQAMARTDNFFEDSSRKRKRSLVSGQPRGGDSSRPSSRGSASRGGRGRGRGGSSSLSKGKGRSRRNDDDNEDDANTRTRVNGNESGLSSDSDEDEEVLQNGEDFFDSEEEEAAAETPAQKRLRIAKQYLESLKAGQGELSWRIVC